MIKTFATCSFPILLSAFLGSSCAENPQHQRQEFPDLVPEEHHELVPDEAFVEINRPCREARMLYNQLMADAVPWWLDIPNNWRAEWDLEWYQAVSTWHPILGPDVYISLKDGDSFIVSFQDQGLDGEVDHVLTADRGYSPSDLWDTIFYRWALDEILDTLRDGENAAGDAALLDAVRDWYAPLRR